MKASGIKTAKETVNPSKGKKSEQIKEAHLKEPKTEEINKMDESAQSDATGLGMEHDHLWIEKEGDNLTG